MVDADLGAAQPTKVFFRHVGAGTIEGVCFLMVDPLHFEAFMQSIPRGGFIGMNHSPFGDTSADERGSLAFRAKNGWHRIAAPFADNDYNLPLPILVASITAVAAVLLLVCWLYIAAKIAAIDFSHLALATDDAALQFLSHCFA